MDQSPNLTYEVRKCGRQGCGLRFPRVGGAGGERCPRCRGETQVLLSLPLAREAVPPPAGQAVLHLEALLDNIRSAGNVGAIFRSADGLGLKALHLAGITATPDNPAVGKTSLGAEHSMAWNYSADGVMLARSLVGQGVRLWALEINEAAQDIAAACAAGIPTGGRLALVVGNEVCGVDPGVLALCERVVCIPMLGAKRSLNAGVAFGIAAYQLISSRPGSRAGYSNSQESD